MMMMMISSTTVLLTCATRREARFSPDTSLQPEREQGIWMDTKTQPQTLPHLHTMLISAGTDTEMVTAWRKRVSFFFKFSFSADDNDV